MGHPDKQVRANQADIVIKVGLDKAFPSDLTSIKWNMRSWRD